MFAWSESATSIVSGFVKGGRAHLGGLRRVSVRVMIKGPGLS